MGQLMLCRHVSLRSTHEVRADFPTECRDFAFVPAPDLSTSLRKAGLAKPLEQLPVRLGIGVSPPPGRKAYEAESEPLKQPQFFQGCPCFCSAPQMAEGRGKNEVLVKEGSASLDCAPCVICSRLVLMRIQVRTREKRVVDLDARVPRVEPNRSGEMAHSFIRPASEC